MQINQKYAEYFTVPNWFKHPQGAKTQRSDIVPCAAANLMFSWVLAVALIFPIYSVCTFSLLQEPLPNTHSKIKVLRVDSCIRPGVKLVRTITNYSFKVIEITLYQFRVFVGSIFWSLLLCKLIRKCSRKNPTLFPGISSHKNPTLQSGCS